MRTVSGNWLRRVSSCVVAAGCFAGGMPLISCDKPTNPPTPAAPVAPVPPAPAAPAPTTPEPTKPAAATSAPTVSTQLSESDKIERMLAALAVSDATFIRSGSEYSGKDAAAHLRMKWGAAGDRVSTAQQFIDLLASSSSASGDAYRIRTKDGKEMPSRDWFVALLASIESGSTSAPPSAAPAAAVKQRTPAEVLEILRTSSATFMIVEDDEIEKHSGSVMATRIGLKYSLAGRPDLSATQFIDQFCTRSSRHNTEYQVRVSDGSSVRLADWLRARLDESPSAAPTSSPTPPTSEPKP